MSLTTSITVFKLPIKLSTSYGQPIRSTFAN